MHSGKAVFFFTPLQKREFCHPHKTVLILVQKIHLFGKFHTKSAQHVINHFAAVCRKEKKISRLSVHRFYQCIHFFFCHKLGEGGFSRSVFRNGDIGQTFCSVAFGELYQLIDLLAGHGTLSLSVDAADASACLKRVFKHAESAVLHNFAYIMKLHTETHIRFVRPETVHGFLPCDPLDRKLHVHIQHFFEKICQKSFIHINNIVHIHERKLHVDLGELRLTVRAEVLIPETTGDLDIAVITGTHQKLFVQLGRLGQSVETSGMDSGGHQIISRAFRSALAQHGRLDLQESFVREEFSGKHCHFALQHDISLKIRPSQIQITVFQTDLVFCLAVLLNGEGRHF